ncbi:ubiquitin-binding SDF ubiquitin ligase complex subunit met30 [Kickxella alabastrina]|uniref:Ubiquitin-binding SDF ubiquitin ligase complex subunit met30 n=1 Tax=Kickxella alabastrina TaxID=61397 RepID=A0ACC1IR23_9FUNG|nr:ubiquitin-binding SDF ubiquitin ligase complex subunit met30 [Kickxella alabastrina]
MTTNTSNSPYSTPIPSATCTTLTPISTTAPPHITIETLEHTPALSGSKDESMNSTLTTYSATHAPNSSFMTMGVKSMHVASSTMLEAEASHDTQQLLFPKSPSSSDDIEMTNTLVPVANGRKRDFSEHVSGYTAEELDILSRRKYPAFGGKCYRHSAHVYLAECDNTQRQLQESLRSLPTTEQQKISGIWKDFASEPTERRLLILQGIVNLCCIPQLSYLNRVVPQQLRVDFMAAAPSDISLKILSYLDAKSLCQAAQVSRAWAALANEDILWHRMCAQHIDKVCKKCGWGLPLLDKTSRRVYEATTRRALRMASTAGGAPDLHSRNRPFRSGSAAAGQTGGAYTFMLPTSSVTIDPTASQIQAPQHQEQEQQQPVSQQMIPVSSLINPTDLDVSLISSVCAPHETVQFIRGSLAPAGGTDTPQADQAPRTNFIPNRDTESGNMSDSSCSNEQRQGGSRSNRRPWKEIFAERQIIANNWRKFRYHESQIQAHTDGILCAQFNGGYMITGSYDSKVHVWDAETFELVSELSGHTMPVRALEFDDCKLFTGSLDGTVKIWNYRDGTCIRTLNAFDNGGVISLHYQRGTLVVGGQNGTIRVYNIAKMTSFTLTGHTDWVNAVRLYGENTLFSCSDDMLVKRWDLEQRRCVRTYSGHSHHVQSLHLSNRAPPTSTLQSKQQEQQRASGSRALGRRGDDDERPFMITGSLDGTMRVWDIETGECLDTIFGHIEGIWSMTFDSLRIVSGSNDGSVKVWDTSSRTCLFTLHTSSVAVNCVALSDTRVVVGDNDGNLRIYDFRDVRQLEASS